MPFVDENEFKPVDLSRPMGLPENFKVTPGAEDLEEGGPDRPSWEWGAALRRNSSIAALAVSEDPYADRTPEPGHDNFKAAIGTPAENYPERLADIPQNRRAFEAFNRQVTREDEDRRRLEGQPWWQGLITEGVGSILDPTTLIPGGAFVRGARGGLTIARTALGTGLAGGAATAVQESILQNIEETRTAGESAMAIGASTILSAALGAGGAALLSKGQMRRAVEAVRAEVDDGVPPPRMGVPGVTIRDEDVAGTAFNEKVMGRPFFYREDGRGAIQAEEMEGGFLRIGLAGVETAGEGLGMPLYLRVMQYADERGLRVVSDESVSADAQKVYAALARRGFEVEEKPSTRMEDGRLQSNDNTHVYEVRNPEHITSSGAPSSAGAAAKLDPTLKDVGVAGRAAGLVGRAVQFLYPNLRLANATAAAPRRFIAQLAELGFHIGMEKQGLTMGPAVETRMAGWNAGLTRFRVDTKEAFVEYAKEAGASWAARTFRPQSAGIMTRQKFREAAGRAAVRGDRSDNPHVQRAAESFRKNIAEPLKNAAIELKMLPPDVKVTTAESYLSRMWKRAAIILEEVRFKGILSHYFMSEMPKEIERFDRAVARRVDPLQREIDYLETAKLRRAEEMRVREEDETAAEFDESDIRQAIRIVQAGAPKPKGVKTLTQFIVEEGGLKVDEWRRAKEHGHYQPGSSWLG